MDRYSDSELTKHHPFTQQQGIKMTGIYQESTVLMSILNPNMNDIIWSKSVYKSLKAAGAWDPFC